MPRLRKVAINNTAIFLTTSVEEGIMFPPNAVTKLLITNCLAKAQEHHPVTVCHFVLMATHLHMLIVVRNPDDVRGFMERFKTESAHAINRLLGRKKRTVWCEGYDSPTLLSAERAIEKIVYIYGNPNESNLVDSIDNYPGLSSWKEYRSGRTTYRTCLIPRDDIAKLPDKLMDHEDYYREARRLSYKKKKARFVIDPNAWMKCFKIEDREEIKQTNEQIVKKLYEEEAQRKELNLSLGLKPLGVRKLMLTPVGTPYQPERSGRRSLCLGDSDQDRIDFIQYILGVFDKGREALEEWRKGNFSVLYPVGIYPPSMPRRGDLLANCYR